MTVLSFIKGCLIMVALIGVVFFAVGLYQIWSTYNFAKTAEVRPGTFSGYQVVQRDSFPKDSSDSRRKTTETLPMFMYTDEKGQNRLETGRKAHLFQRFKHGDKVKVLVSRDGAGPPRLGDPFSLYGGGTGLCLIGITLIILIFFGIGKVDHFLRTPAENMYETQTGIHSYLRQISRSRLPVGDMVIIVGGFLLLAGGMIGFGSYIVIKRQDPALITAIQKNDIQRARILAAEGRGIDGRNSDKETALIVALKANQPHVARAILSCWVNANTAASDGTSAAQLAAANGDHRTLAMLLKKGAQTFSIKQYVVHDLIAKGDTATLSVIFDNNFDLDRKYMRLSFGDHAVIQGKADVVRLIQTKNGLFKAPPAFIALVLNDPDALNAALQTPGAFNEIFHKLTLRKFAQKIGREKMLEKAGD